MVGSACQAERSAVRGHEMVMAWTNRVRVMAREKDLGTVEPGKYADLIILDENPLTEISNTRKIHRVIKDGLVLEPDILLAEHIRHFGERGSN